MCLASQPHLKFFECLKKHMLLRFPIFLPLIVVPNLTCDLLPHPKLKARPEPPHLFRIHFPSGGASCLRLYLSNQGLIMPFPATFLEDFMSIYCCLSVAFFLLALSWVQHYLYLGKLYYTDMLCVPSQGFVVFELLARTFFILNSGPSINISQVQL